MATRSHDLIKIYILVERMELFTKRIIFMPITARLSTHRVAGLTIISTS